MSRDKVRQGETSRDKVRHGWTRPSVPCTARAALCSATAGGVTPGPARRRMRAHGARIAPAAGPHSLEDRAPHSAILPPPPGACAPHDSQGRRQESPLLPTKAYRLPPTEEYPISPLPGSIPSPPRRGGEGQGEEGAFARATVTPPSSDPLPAPPGLPMVRASGPPRAPVAQLDRALPSEGRGRTFESCRVRHPPSTLCVASKPTRTVTRRRLWR